MCQRRRESGFERGNTHSAIPACGDGRSDRAVSSRCRNLSGPVYRAWAPPCLSAVSPGTRARGCAGRRAGQWLAGVCFLSPVVCKMAVGKRYIASFSLASQMEEGAPVRGGSGDVSMATMRRSLTTQRETRASCRTRTTSLLGTLATQAQRPLREAPGRVITLELESTSYPNTWAFSFFSARQAPHVIHDV